MCDTNKPEGKKATILRYVLLSMSQKQTHFTFYTTEQFEPVKPLSTKLISKMITPNHFVVKRLYLTISF